MPRARALALLGGAVAAGCQSAPRTVAVGSKDFTEELLLGNMYALMLEHAGIPVTRKLDLGGTQVAMEALQRGDIDLYPEYTGTALISELKLKPSHDAKTNYATVAREYDKRYDLRWLRPSPFNDSQGLATTQDVRKRYRLRTLADLSKAAPHLRLGAIPEFTKREDGLPGLQRAFGGFKFASVKLFDIGLKYKAIESGQVDVVVAFTTDGQLLFDNLFLIEDPTHFWPAYQAAPVVRAGTLAAFPQIPRLLNRIAPLLTDARMRQLNGQIDGDKQDPADVARAFLEDHRAFVAS